MAESAVNARLAHGREVPPDRAVCLSARNQRNKKKKIKFHWEMHTIAYWTLRSWITTLADTPTADVTT